MHHVAIDVHDEYSQVCAMSSDREVNFEGRVPTTKSALADFFSQRAPSVVVFEAGPHSLWISELLTKLGHEVVVCHPRQIRLIAESRNKNDRVDAELLVRLSWSDLELLKPIRQRSRTTLEQRSVIRTRAAIVEMQKQLRTMLRGLIKPFGVRLPTARKRAVRMAAEIELPPIVRTSVDALLATLTTLAEQIEHLEGQVEQLADQHQAAARLITVPGVGPLVAISYIYAIEDPTRFAATDVGPYLGLTPSNRSSAGKKLSPRDRGRPGDPYVRSLLVQAAWTLMNSRSESDLARWGRKLIERVGPKKAAIAVARKLATVMHHLWLHDCDFIAHPNQGCQTATA